MKILKQKLLLLIWFIILAITSCKKTEIAPANKDLKTEDAQKVSSVSHLLYQYHSNKSIDLTDPKYYEYNSCAGDRIHILKGIWHIETNHIYNGQLESIQFHTNTSDYRLIDLTTGIKYTGSYASNDVLTIDAVNQDFQVTQTLAVLLTTPGGGNNSMLIADVHVKLDSNGDVILLVDNMRAGCQ